MRRIDTIADCPGSGTIVAYKHRMTMLRQAPPLEATEAFLAAARAPSFRAAADAIALSPSAFSRRIQMLESFVGVALFDRSGPSVQLTEAGARYFNDIAPALDTIRRATAALRERGESRVLRLITSHSLAVGWLLARMPALEREHGIEIELTIGHDPQRLSSGEADLAIWGGKSGALDFRREQLIDLRAIPVCSVHLPGNHDVPRDFADLRHHRLLAARSDHDVWRQWRMHWDRCEAPSEPVVRYDTLHLMYEAAANGLGIALAVPILADRFIEERRLQPRLGPAVAMNVDYSLYYAAPDVSRRRTVRTFVDWLRHAIADSETRFDNWSETAVSDAASYPPCCSTITQSKA